MNLGLPFEACLYRGRWAVLCHATNTYSFIGVAAASVSARPRELNAQAERERWPKPAVHSLCCD